MSLISEKIQLLSFEIILYAGNARTLAMEAIPLAKKGKYTLAKEKMAQANEELNKAHTIQTNFLQNEGKGIQTEISILLIHAQDHLMSTITVKELANEMIEMYKHMESLREEKE